MESGEYNFEIETIIKQFISMLNGAIVKRYDVNEETRERITKQIIQPEYICSTKQRVMWDLVNKAKNYVLPCVCISLTGISLAMDRISAKFTPRTRLVDRQRYTYRYPSPVNITFKVSIIAKYITDLYQIYAKLCSQFQNSQCFSWYVPHDGDVDKSQYEEIISQVSWDGNIAFDLKPERRESDEDKFTGDMTFTITGWIFPDVVSVDGNIILDIGTTNYIPDYLNGNILMLSTYKPLVHDVMKDQNLPHYKNPREWNNGHPRITNVFRTYMINDKLVYFYLDRKRMGNHTITAKEDASFVIDGYCLDCVDVLFVPKNNKQFASNNEYIEYDYSTDNYDIFPLRDKMNEKLQKIGGYKIKVLEQSRNRIAFNLNDIDYVGDFDILVADRVDYDSISDAVGATPKFLGYDKVTELDKVKQ